VIRSCGLTFSRLRRRWSHRAFVSLPFVRMAALAAFATSVLSLSGCAAFRPIDGIPARYVPDEIKAATRSGKKTIDLSLLSQTQPSVYHLDAGDVLAVYIEGVLPKHNESPPINMPRQGEEGAPSLGYPIPVRQDGTISLPMLTRSVLVRGLTVKEVEDSIRRAYTVDKKILQTGTERVWVILHKPRQYRIVVIRQEGVEAPAIGQPGAVNLGALKRGTGRVVTLTAYKNDVLHALTETGGLPGLDAENTIYVLRGKRRTEGVGPENSNTAPRINSGWSVGPAPKSVHSPFPILPVPPEPVPPEDLDSLPGVSERPHEGSPELPGPQSRSTIRNTNSGLQLAVLAFNAGESPGRVTPITVNTDPPRRARPTMTPPGVMHPGSTYPGSSSAHAVPMLPGTVPMVSPTADLQVGLPPTHAVGDWRVMSYGDWLGHSSASDPTLANQNITKIPVRLAPGEPVQFTERDILLEDGDIVFIESRDTEIFYTGGLLGGGQHTLPRDYDLDVLGAIAIAQAANSSNGGASRATGGISALNQDVTIGASQAIILRRMPNGTQVPIKVDLYRAVRHPEERVLMQPGDYLVLQYTPLQAVGAFVERHLFEGALFGVAAAQINRGGN
jgi:protein involved in polysaccharide export with SLBB domain